MLLFYHAGSQNHRRQGHGDILLLVREADVDHRNPGGTAGGAHIGLLFRHLLQEVLCLVQRTEIGADCHLHDGVEAQQLHGRRHLLRRQQRAELAHKGRGQDGDDLVAALDRVNELENLAFVHNRSEGTGDKALAAGDAAVVVDLGASIFVRTDGVHAAGLHTGPLQLDDRVVGAGVGATAAFDALLLIDGGLAMDKLDGVFGTDLMTALAQTALAEFRDAVLLGRAGIAGKIDNVNQRRVVVLLRHGALVDAVGKQGVFLDRAKRQTHGQPDALAGNGTLQENGLTVGSHFAGNDDIGQLFHPAVVAVVGHPGHLSKDFFPNIRDKRRNSTHDVSSNKCKILFLFYKSFTLCQASTVEKQEKPHRRSGVVCRIVF